LVPVRATCPDSRTPVRPHNKRNKGRQVKRSKGRQVKRSKGRQVKRSKGRQVKRSKGRQLKGKGDYVHARYCGYRNCSAKVLH
jgi:hypothetical protein